MHEIESPFRQRIGGYIVTPHFEFREVEGLKKSGIDVCRQHSSRRADAIREPARDGPAATAYFQAVPTPPHAARFQVTNSARIKQGGKDSESFGRLSGAVVKQVA